MTTPNTAPPADAQWGVQFEGFYMEDLDSHLPPWPADIDADPNDAEGYAAAQAQWQAGIDAWNAAMNALLADDANFKVVVNNFPTEDIAREMLRDMRNAAEGSPYARNHQLVWAPAIVWTVVPVE
ncbi:hypothetical protein SEA_FUNSIZED_37 [Mycobacterium phage Funsized]|nr:hypothetical protein SEA_FUNSIZED_37 [Mycobacterium phage Funsized]